MDEAVKKSVLVVDDEEIIRSFLFEVLSEEFAVSLACDGDEAIEEVVKFACENDPNSKVIVISGFSSLYTVSQSINNGACAFLSKPFSIKELMQSVSNAVGA